MKGKPGKACLCMLLLLVSMIHFGSQAYAQKPTSRMITVIGNVSDESGEPLAGVSVMLQGTKIGVSTDADGNYTIRFLPRKDQENIIVYSFIGMEEQTFNAKASVQNDVILKSLDSELDQVVVNGFYTQKKSTFTGAATTIKGETLVELSPTNLLVKHCRNDSGHGAGGEQRGLVPTRMRFHRSSSEAHRRLSPMRARKA